MNEFDEAKQQHLAQLSRQVADAPIPEDIRARLIQARQAAVAQAALPHSRASGVWALVYSHPKISMASLFMVLIMSVTLLQQQQSKPMTTSIDLALLSSDVAMDDLLDPTLLDAQSR
ncbi:hypothetical protein [Deefgea piscis]|uniref:hypothetical protein n=1 Tax=Deefgea piscis TaxID=2739061 RepID=UPI001C7FF7FC|nr:hypothetical protein [Deefgea piscis]QZA81877.1 hypothetical protein K4H25_04290 [Deefgea piscis]